VIEADPVAGTVQVMRRPLRWDGSVCDRLSQSQLLALRRFTGRHLHLANAAWLTSPVVPG
jgi:hypothetical protein